MELAGQLLAILFEDLLKVCYCCCYFLITSIVLNECVRLQRFNSDIKRNVDKSLEKKHHAEMFDPLKFVRPDTIANGY